MMNNFDKNIQELLKSHTEQPSADCWNSISSQLDANQVPDSNTGSSSAASSSENYFSQFVGSIAGKVASVIIATAVIGGIIALIVVNSPENEPQIEDETIIISEKTQNEPPILKENVENANELTVLPSKDENTFSTIETLSSDKNNESVPQGGNKNYVVTNPAHDVATVLSPVQSETENTTKAEVATKTDEKTQVITINEPKKKSFANNKKIESVSDVAENETPQNVIELPKFTIPNFFTPNGDGVNDSFVIEGIEQFSENQLYIYDKNGRVVYEKKNYKNNWTAENLPDGVYYYIFTFVYQETQSMRKGSITIRR